MGNDKIQVKFVAPYEICIFCRAIKTICDLHVDCFKKYHEKLELINGYNTIAFDNRFIYPELTHLFYRNNKKYFPLSKFDRTHFTTCTNIKNECKKCCYHINEKNKTISIGGYNTKSHNYFWECFNTNTMPKKFKSTCGGNYVIHKKCINEHFDDFTPCHYCDLPRFLHQIDYVK